MVQNAPATNFGRSIVTRINGRSVIACGLLAGIVWTVLSAVVTMTVGMAFEAAVPGNRLAAPSVPIVAFNLALNLIGGIWVVWTYAAIRPRFGKGPRTAMIAGLSWWIVSSTVDATWGSFGFVSAAALIGPMIASLPALLAATMIGAWRYSEPEDDA
jgi:hypothetical protein